MRNLGGSRKGCNTKHAMKRATFYLWLAACVHALHGQSNPDQLNARYGPPIEELFRVRTNVALVVSYGEKRQICKLELRPLQYDGVIKLALIDELVKEIAPGMVGQLTGIICTGLCIRSGEGQDFIIEKVDQDVEVSRKNHFGEGWLAVIQFKGCQ
jgi:hypothetical protein